MHRRREKRRLIHVAKIHKFPELLLFFGKKFIFFYTSALSALGDYRSSRWLKSVKFYRGGYPNGTQRLYIAKGVKNCRLLII